MDEVVQDVESTPEFQALVVAAAGKPERAMGESVIPAEPPNWSEVKSLAKALVAEPPHLAVLIHLTRAETHLRSFSGLLECLQQIRTSLTDSWDQVMPLADEDDPDDMYYERINFLHELSDDPAYIDALYKTSLVDVRGLGSFSSRDIAIARGQDTGSEEDIARCQEGLIRGAFQECEPELLQVTADALAAIPEECQQLEALFADRAGTDNPLNLAHLIAKVKDCRVSMFEFAGDLLAPEEPEEASDEETEGLVATKRIVKGSLKNREAVCHAFDRIIEYYQANEPASPVPVLVVRARDMVPKSFFDVLQELAPLSKDDFRTMLTSVMGNPLAYLITDSYRMYMGGQLVVASVSEPPAPAVESAGVENAVSEVVTDSAVEAIAESAPDGDHSAEGQASEDVASNVEETTDVDFADSSALNQAQDDVQAEPVAQSIPESHDEAPISQKASGGDVLSSVDSRSEVLDVLGEIDIYFSNHEPSSPIPLIVNEVRKLVSKNFLELLDEFDRATRESEAVAEEAASSDGW